MNEINGLYIGDVEETNEGLFIRIYYLDKERQELNEKFNAHFSMSEWITMVLNLKTKEVKHIVAYSEADNKEYDVSSFFTESQINNFIKGSEHYVSSSVW